MADVFISYSHRNTAFALRLHDSLTGMEHAAWIDRENIPSLTEWWVEIRTGIEEADNFVFIISPDSLASVICMLEFAHALDKGKRIVPLLLIEPDENVAMAAIVLEAGKNRYDEILEKRNLLEVAGKNFGILRKIHRISFEDGNDFETSLNKLVEAINRDQAHVSQHTRLLVRAREWEVHEKSADRLLKGEALVEAQEWLKGSREKEPRPIPLHDAFIEASVIERAREEAEKQLNDRVRRFILRLGTSTAGFAAGLGAVMALLYVDSGERLFERISIALLSLGLSTYFGAGMVIVTEFLPLLRTQKRRAWQQAGLLALAWFICCAVIIIVGYIYYGDAALRWQPFSALLIVGGFALPVYVTNRLGWRVAVGMVGTFAALFVPWLLDPLHAPIGFDSTSGDVSAPLSAWMALTFVGGTYLPEILRWLRGH